ncbi:JmjC domain-containing protein [Mucor velutinosus]|uniref:JmjC domain-containing protein n=1 Tax=Mucor velutinosus TaxID=708070 RepID=A0AAN7DA74_9FUNG|nr:JmjC domain-containing protein [Mucor velutinosus]
MRHALLCDELDNITRSYDYGIVPGSATVFVKDELNNIGRLDLTLLEGVMIVVEVSEEGYKVGSCSPLSSTGTALATAQIVQKNLEVPFETMDNLLMAVSPMFRERFQQALYDKLESVHRHQQQQSPTVPITSATSTTSPSIPSLASGPSIQQHQTSHILLQQPSLLQQNTHLQHQPQQQPSHMTQQLMHDQSTLDITTQEVLDDLHNWIH